VVNPAGALCQRGLSLIHHQLDLGIDLLEWLNLGLELDRSLHPMAEQDFAGVAEARSPCPSRGRRLDARKST
jgi:hypothetical protein